MNAEAEQSELSTFERFLYWFVVPVVFLIVLLTVLMTLFGYDTKGEIMRMAGKLPLVGSYIQDSKSAPADKTAEEPAAKDAGLDQQIATLTAKIQQQEADLKLSEEQYAKKDQEAKELQAKNDQLEEQLKSKTLSDEEYVNQIRQTSTMYAKMMPSKAAPIIENLTLQERVLILSEMKVEDRVRILEKMDPKIAAEASIYLKDTVPVRDREIAALQERLKLKEAEASKGTQKLTGSDIGETFANMTPKSAATILIEMYGVNSAKVIDILSAAETQARSKIMSEMATLDKAKAAAISNRLTP